MEGVREAEEDALGFEYINIKEVRACMEQVVAEGNPTPGTK